MENAQFAISTDDLYMLVQDEDTDNVNNGEEVNHAILDDNDEYKYIAEDAGSSLNSPDVEKQDMFQASHEGDVDEKPRGMLLHPVIVQNSDKQMFKSLLGCKTFVEYLCDK